MKKIFILLFFFLFLIGCNAQTTATNVTTLTDTNLNTSIDIPVLDIFENVLVWDEITGCNQYEVYLHDVTSNGGSLLLEDEYILVDTNEYDISLLIPNREWDIMVRAIIGEEHSAFSIGFSVSAFVNSEINYDYELVVGSNHDYIVFPESLPALFYIKYINQELSTASSTWYNVIPASSYFTQYGRLFIDRNYFSDLSEELRLFLYSEDGIITIDLNISSITKPFIVSSNTIVFSSDDVIMVFEFCGGTFDEITGSDISSSDYDLEDNVLIIHQDFISNLFNDNLDRNSVILSYQLRNNSDIILGFIYINRS
ncbi:MAG: hypothetical protein KJ971_04105 [Firmicutes bacterium]|nr:hypothetical protein [Bacillota bacterium]